MAQTTLPAGNAYTNDRATYAYRKGVSPNTLSEISSKTKIFATAATGTDNGVHNQIGVISQFDPSETRNIETVRGIGFGDMVAELVPGVTEPMSLSVTRTAQYLAGIYQVFGYKGGIDGLVRSLKHHRWPFDIHKETVFSSLVASTSRKPTESNEQLKSPTAAADGAAILPASKSEEQAESQQALLTIFEGCWIQDWNTSYTSDSALVQENCTMMVSDVYDGSGTWSSILSNPATGNAGNSARTKN